MVYFAGQRAMLLHSHQERNIPSFLLSYYPKFIKSTVVNMIAECVTATGMVSPNAMLDKPGLSGKILRF